jgi:hypothetical protein
MLPFRVFLRGIGKGSNLSRRGSLRSINKRSHLSWRGSLRGINKRSHLPRFPPLSGEDKRRGFLYSLPLSGGESKRGFPLFSPPLRGRHRRGFHGWKPHPNPLLRGEGEVFPLSGEFVFHFPLLSGEDKRRGFRYFFCPLLEKRYCFIKMLSTLEIFLF